MTTYRLLHGDCREVLAMLPDASVRCCVTSPPYWGLRDYGITAQIGLESTPAEYVAALVGVFRDVRRVLADDGVLWLNLGDSYVSVGGTQPGVGAKRIWRDGAGRADGVVDERGQRNRNGVTLRGLPAKNLIGIPWRVAFALQADGWWLRSDVIWAKPNPMPESVTDRPTKSHEYVFLLSKAERYYYDAAAIAERGAEPERVRKNEPFGGANGASVRHGAQSVVNGTIATRNARTVWNIATQPYRDAHFAVMPEALAAPCILAGSRVGDTILDPFSGAGTTGVVAVRNGRNYIGIDANAEYVALSRARIESVAPLFVEERNG